MMELARGKEREKKRKREGCVHNVAFVKKNNPGDDSRTDTIHEATPREITFELNHQFFEEGKSEENLTYYYYLAAAYSQEKIEYRSNALAFTRTCTSSLHAFSVAKEWKA